MAARGFAAAQGAGFAPACVDVCPSFRPRLAGPITWIPSSRHPAEDEAFRRWQTIAWGLGAQPAQVGAGGPRQPALA